MLVRTIELQETICPVCERPAIGGATHARCKTKYTIDGLISFFRYEGAVRKAIKELKYRFVSDLAAEFISLIPDDHLQSLSVLRNPKPETRNSFIVPIPLHSARFRYRGFNQAELLGRLIAEKLETSLRTDILYRARSTTPQVEMKDRDERLKNMARVFSSRISNLNARNSIILFDDVFTTGATLRAAAKVLKRAGAPFVWGITMAR